MQQITGNVSKYQFTCGIIFELLQASDSASVDSMRRALDLKAGTKLRLEARRPNGEMLDVELQAREFELSGRAAIHTVWRDLARTELEIEAVPHRSPRPDTLLDLVDRLIATDTEANAAKEIKIKALRHLADETLNAPTRNYLILSAYELAETIDS